MLIQASARIRRVYNEPEREQLIQKDHIPAGLNTSHNVERAASAGEVKNRE
jgi:hypothetical protein